MKSRQLGLIIFLIIELYIYVFAMCFNQIVSTNILLIISSFLCFITGILLFCKTKDYYIVISALFLHLLTDTFSVIFDDLVIIRLIGFNIIQIFYFLRIYLDTQYKTLNLVSRSVSIMIFIILGYFLLNNKFNYIAILWILYISNLFINILMTIKEIGINNFFPISLLFMFIYGAFSMILYLENYVDINIPLVNILSNLPFDIRLMFYLPSEVIMTCSIFTVNRRSYSKKKEEN